MMGSIRRRLEDLRARVERTAPQPLHSPAWPRVLAHLERRVAIRQGAETTPEELDELERFEETMAAEIAERRARGLLEGEGC